MEFSSCLFFILSGVFTPLLFMRVCAWRVSFLMLGQIHTLKFYIWNICTVPTEWRCKCEKCIYVFYVLMFPTCLFHTLNDLPVWSCVVQTHLSCLIWVTYCGFGVTFLNVMSSSSLNPLHSSSCCRSAHPRVSGCQGHCGRVQYSIYMYNHYHTMGLNCCRPLLHGALLYLQYNLKCLFSILHNNEHTDALQLTLLQFCCLLHEHIANLCALWLHHDKISICQLYEYSVLIS